MRFVFMDEAGTSAHEPVTVVVGLIADADEHLMSAEALVLELLGSVPEKFKQDFTFHATQVYGDRKYQGSNGWSLTDRLRLLNDMMSVPRRIGLAITLAAHWRGASGLSEIYGSLGLNPAQSDHFHTFMECIALSDRYIRRHAGPREVGAVVAEDCPEMRKFLKCVPQLLRENPMVLSPQDMRTTVSDAEAGYSLQSGDFRVTRIRNSVHFVEKRDDPLVQVADACAYGFRRYFAGEKFGVDFVRSIVGHESVLRDFAPPGGAECYWPTPRS